MTEQTSRSSAQEIDTRFSFDCKKTNLFVERLEKDKDTDKDNPNPNHDRTVKPVVCFDASHAQGASQTRSSHESTNFNVEAETNHDRTVKPVVCRDASHAQGHEQSMLNEVDIDCRILGLPHSVVKQAENSRSHRDQMRARISRISKCWTRRSFLL